MDEQVDEISPVEDADAPDETAQAKVVPRELPKPEPARAALVEFWQKEIREARDHWEPAFKRMREWQRFVRGKQWPGEVADAYVTNVTLRHVKQKTARLYAKNPKAVAQQRRRIEYTVWDGSVETLVQTQAALQMAQQAGPALQESGDPATMQIVQQQVAQAQAILKDYQEVAAKEQMLKRLAETLEILYDYNVDEQALPFKAMLKRVVWRTLVNGVSWVRVGFQRVSQLRPEYESRIEDVATQLAAVEQLAADLADGVIQEHQPEAEELRLRLAELTKAGTRLREGLVFDYPGSASIIPDQNCRCLKTFTGARWVAQEHFLSPQEVQRVYGIDIRSAYTPYGSKKETGRPLLGAPSGAGLEAVIGDTASKGNARVFEVYHKDSGLVFVVCEGFPEFLQEPAAPDTWSERFYPWFGLAFTAVEDDDDEDDASLFPPSEVSLIMESQREINRSREAMRDHRIANAPKYFTPTGMLSDTDKQKIEQARPHTIIELQAMQPGQKVGDVLGRGEPVPIDPNLYETNPYFEDILRAGGLQEANMGGTHGATATESSIAQASLDVDSTSDVDELDDLLSALARTGSQILLNEVDEMTVKEIVGAGAIWPKMTPDQIARDLWLEVEAGSTGRPNQAREIANIERVVPLLLQLPGLKPEELTKEVLRRLDDRLDLNRMMAPGTPSIISMNQQMQPSTGDPSTDPEQQGGQGGQKAVPGKKAPDSAQGVKTDTPMGSDTGV